jgi:hypothetical protein
VGAVSEQRPLGNKTKAFVVIQSLMGSVRGRS